MYHGRVCNSSTRTGPQKVRSESRTAEGKGEVYRDKDLEIKYINLTKFIKLQNDSLILRFM